MPCTSGFDRRNQLPEIVSIHVHAAQIYDRVMFGHWGGNFIKGAGNKILGGRAACAFRQLDAVRS